jgi:inosine-uridine nucleoside N-ribohydrolase
MMMMPDNADFRLFDLPAAWHTLSMPNILSLARWTLSATLLCAAVGALAATDGPPKKSPPVKVIFDTDIGNDVDDVLALSMLHALMTRGDCELLAVTVTKPDEPSGPFTDAMNTFYGRPDMPVAVIRNGFSSGPGKFLPLANVKDHGQLRFPRDLKSNADTPEPNQLLRQLLGRQPDGSVTLVQVGFFSNFAALLDTPADEFSPLPGRDLIKQKVKLLSIMAGAFQTIKHGNHYLEYNVIKDIPAAQKLAKSWPTPIVWSGFEIGITVPYPAISIDRDFGYVPHHPAAEAYYLYNPPPHERPTWDLTAVLYAVHPDRDYFELSSPGQVTVEADGFTRFAPKKEGRDRFLILNDVRTARVKEALVQLSSQPPK